MPLNRIEFLAAASAALASSLEYEKTLSTLAHLAVPDVADWCFVEGLQADGSIRLIAVGHTDPEMERVAHETLRRYPVALDAPFGTGKVVRTGEPELIPDIPPELLAAVAQSDEHREILQRVGFRSNVTVPMIVHGRTVGALTLVQAESGRRFTPADLGLVQELALRAAVAIDNARLFRAEREAHTLAELAAERARRLQELTTRLNQAVSRDQIADAIFEGGLAAVGADAGSLAIVQRGDGGRPTGFEIVRSSGISDELRERYRFLPLLPERPLSEVVHSRRPVFVESPEEWRRRFPAAPEDLQEIGMSAFAGVPVVAGERVLAALSFGFHRAQSFDAGTRTLLATLGEQCALALERQRLHETELRLAEEQAALLATIQDGFIAVDAGLRYTYVNAEACRMLQRTSEQLLGRKVLDVFPDAEGHPFYEGLARTVRTGHAGQFEAYSTLARRWLSARFYPAPQGGASMVFQDVTARRREQEAAAFLADASRLLSASLDYHDTLRALADAAVPRLGDWCAVDLIEDPTAGEWPPHVERVAVVHRDPGMLALGAELTGSYPVDWTDEGGFASVLRTGRPLFVPEVTDEMLAATARDANHLDLLRRLQFSSVIVVPLSTRGLSLGALTLCMTDSQRRYDETDLDIAQDLAQRAATAVDNARLFREAERARADAEAANRTKSEFLTNMSHELRTPLNAIGGYTDLLELGIHGNITDPQREALARIQRNQKHLLRLINDLLSFARIESGAMSYELEPLAVSDVVQAAAALIDPLRATRSISLQLESAAPLTQPPLRVLADRDKLQQILINVLSNAVKFTPAGGRIAITYGVREDPAHPGAERVFIDIADTGIGIPGDRLDAIFEPFVQIGRTLANPVEGTGLGLAISRDLARAMGGDLRALSEPGGGSTFALTLPLPPEEGRPGAPRDG